MLSYNNNNNNNLICKAPECQKTSVVLPGITENREIKCKLKVAVVVVMAAKKCHSRIS